MGHLTFAPATRLLKVLVDGEPQKVAMIGVCRPSKRS
jgi:hypothetical protein